MLIDTARSLMTGGTDDEDNDVGEQRSEHRHGDDCQAVHEEPQ